MARHLGRGQLSRMRGIGRSAFVAALATSTTTAYGVLFYAYGVLLLPMEDELGWSRTFLSGAFSCALVVGAVLTVPVGRWLDRHAPRALFVSGALMATGLLLAWSQATDRAAFVAVWVLLGACQAVLFYEPAFTVLTKWYTGRQRHRAITTVTLAGGLASTVFGPLTAVLDRNLGWRSAVVGLAAGFAVVTLPTLFFGVRLPETSRPQPHEADALPSEVVRTRSFRLLTLAYLLNAVTTFAVAVHLVAYLRGRSVGAGVAATALGAVGLVQVLGRSAFLRLSAFRTSLQLGTWVLVAKAAGLALLLLFPGVAGMAAFVVVYGAANGVATLTRATAVAELYGATHYGSISGVIASVGALGGALAPFLAAAAIDLVGGETPVFAGLAAVSLLAAAANHAVRPSSSPSPARG